MRRGTWNLSCIISSGDVFSSQCLRADDGYAASQEEQALAPIAASISIPVPPPTSRSPAQQQVAQSLANTPEPAFDALYINSEITGHQANIASNFTPEIQTGGNQLVVAYANSTLPQIQMHLQMAQQIKARYNF